MTGFCLLLVAMTQQPLHSGPYGSPLGFRPSPSWIGLDGLAGRLAVPFFLRKVSAASAMAALILPMVVVSLFGISSVTPYFGSPPSSDARGSKILTYEKRTFPVMTFVLIVFSP